MSEIQIPLTPHLANQTGHWESTENEKSLPGTVKGIPTNGSSRLNALCDYLKLWKTFQRNKETPFPQELIAAFLSQGSSPRFKTDPLHKMGKIPLNHPEQMYL